MPPRHVIGLTGNIASGKSAVSAMLAEHGAEVIDADLVAREVLAAGSDEVADVVERFGASILREDGSIDRAKLGRIVFSDPTALADLEAIVHPGTRRRIFERLANCNAQVVVLEAIKLLEGPLAERADSIWVVTAPRDVRIRRLMEGRGLSSTDAEQRVGAQNPEEEKVRRADVVLVNDGSLDSLRNQVDAAWARLLDSGVGRGC
jgi:dephospho-CoA kinase